MAGALEPIALTAADVDLPRPDRGRVALVVHADVGEDEGHLGILFLAATCSGWNVPPRGR